MRGIEIGRYAWENSIDWPNNETKESIEFPVGYPLYSRCKDSNKTTFVPSTLKTLEWVIRYVCTCRLYLFFQCYTVPVYPLFSSHDFLKGSGRARVGKITTEKMERARQKKEEDEEKKKKKERKKKRVVPRDRVEEKR